MGNPIPTAQWPSLQYMGLLINNVSYKIGFYILFELSLPVHRDAVFLGIVDGHL